MLTKPSRDSRLMEDLQTLARTENGQALILWLTTNRTQILELMTQVTDEIRLRQFQGAAVVLKELTDTLTRIPERPA